MTAADAGRPAPGWLRFLAWLSHFELYFFVPTVGLVVTNAVVRIFLGDTALTWITGLLVMIAAVLGTLSVFAHDKVWPCDPCTERFPLDASAEAARRMRWLRIHHWRKRTTIGILAACYAVLIVPPYILPDEIAGFSILPILVYWGVMARSNRVHATLQPWCPWCRRRDEGDDPIVIPEPTPPSAKVDA